MPTRVSIRLLFCSIVVVGVAVLAGLLIYLNQDQIVATAINMPNCLAIRPGMSKADVESLLGGPPRSEATGKLTPLLPESADDMEREIKSGWLASHLEEGGDPTWVSDEAIIVVLYDENTRVLDKEAMPLRRLPQPKLLPYLLQWLGFGNE
jgi:hypothetical protein